MASYLVTGAAGFIGGKLAERLIDNGHRVVSIDNLTTGSHENIPDGVEFYQADCQDADVYQQLEQEKFDAIFHIAGQSSGEISFDNPQYDLRTNAESTLHLLKFALATGCSRMIYASTMSVYGVKPDRPIREDENTSPMSFYGVAKLASEHYLRLYEQYGIRSTALRLFNVYGPGQNMENLRQGMVSIYLAQMLENGHIHIKGDMGRYRDFIYIDDVVDAFLACLDHPDSEGEIINIGTGIRTTVSELVEQLIDTVPEKITYKSEGSTPGDLFGIYADIAKASRLLDFSPQYNLQQGLKTMVDWAKTQGNKV